MTFADILTETRERVAADRKRYPPATIENETLFDTRADDFAGVFLQGETSIITEIKYGSPSRGRIVDPAILDPVDVARAYVSGGAKALSILTEPRYFHGAYEYVSAVRKEHPRIPIIMKDFILEAYQVHLARYLGASVVLLVVRYLDEAQLQDLYRLAVELGLDVLVEVHDTGELETAAGTGCRVMGVNNRNLETLAVDLSIGRALAPHFPAGVISICESGIFRRAEIDEFSSLGYDGFLVGTSLMQDGRPGEALRALISPQD